VRVALREVAPGFPVYDMATMEVRVSMNLAYPQTAAVLLSLFAAVAVTLAAIGTYGVISFAVAQRTREMGVRLALGATSADLARLVVGQGVVLGGLGLASGVAAALAVTRLLRTMLYDVEPTDPITYASIVGVLAIVVLAASWVPARRAASVPAVEVLRAS
jgi:ABC-type antimicrobial peptide transport system permease subunit